MPALQLQRRLRVQANAAHITQTIVSLLLTPPPDLALIPILNILSPNVYNMSIFLVLLGVLLRLRSFHANQANETAAVFNQEKHGADNAVAAVFALVLEFA